jgi:hypothetical protein
MVELAQDQVNRISETTQAASSVPATPTFQDAAEQLAKANADLASAGIQLGWTAPPSGAGAWASKIIGLLVSILAISLGAPFWFDILNRVMQVRAAGASPREKKPQAQ